MSFRKKPSFQSSFLIKLIVSFRACLKLSDKLSKQNNSDFFFVYLPEFSRYKSKNYDLNDYQKIKSMVNYLEIPFIDIHEEVFEKENNPLKLFPFESNGHYTIEGYKKIAEAGRKIGIVFQSFYLIPNYV